MAIPRFLLRKNKRRRNLIGRGLVLWCLCHCLFLIGNVVMVDSPRFPKSSGIDPKTALEFFPTAFSLLKIVRVTVIIPFAIWQRAAHTLIMPSTYYMLKRVTRIQWLVKQKTYFRWYGFRRLVMGRKKGGAKCGAFFYEGVCFAAIVFLDVFFAKYLSAHCLFTCLLVLLSLKIAQHPKPADTTSTRG